MERLRVFYYNNKQWFYTIQYIVFSLFLLGLVALVDLRLIPLIDFIPESMTMTVAFSQSILIALSAAFLTITTFTFSTILTVLNMYASNFTPRVVENFINMSITLKVIGIFIGGFFYCIGALLFTRGSIQQASVIAGSVAILYSIVCIGYFIAFVQRVLTKFQGVNMILELAGTAQGVIDDELELRRKSEGFSISKEQRVETIYSTESGYFSVIDFKGLLDGLDAPNTVIQIISKVGEYIVDNCPIAKVYTLSEDIEAITDIVRQVVILQDKKFEKRDYRYTLTKILEIALRAISPGINDPNTAIHCINKLGVLLIVFAKLDTYHIQKASSNKVSVYYSSYSFKEDLYYFYVPLIHYGKADLNVVCAVIDSLTMLYRQATPKNKDAICEFFDYIHAKVMPLMTTAYEQEEVTKRLDLVKKPKENE